MGADGLRILLMKYLLLIAAGWLLVPSVGHAFGKLGHRAIAEAARQMLSDDARAGIKAILGNDDLSAIALWMDEARNIANNKETALTGEAYDEAVAFNGKHPGNDQWHFVNLPVLATNLGYDPNGLFARPDDIVHALGEAIAVLEGKSAKYNAEDALRVITHLAGDIHQPLHTVAGYFDVKDLKKPVLVSDPQKAKGFPKDRGGNKLIFLEDFKLRDLHGLLDGGLMDEIGGADVSEEVLVKKLVVTKDERKALETPGDDPHQWPALWATDSAAAAAGVYEKLSFGQAKVEAGAPVNLVEIRVTLPDGYHMTQAPLIERQMRKAAVHLAQLLNAIKFK
jgi:hypothetical protein